MAESKHSCKDVDQFLKCTICLSTFNHPKQLPCLHTFCLVCLRGYCAEEIDGFVKPCPMCRKKFTIPEGGVEKLPNDNFLKRLVLEKRISEECKRIKCDLCHAIDEKAEAESCCNACEQWLRFRCKKKHSMESSSKSHVVVSIADKRMAGKLNNINSSNCPKHPNKELEFHCCDCNKPICYVCRSESHTNHNCSVLQDFIKRNKEVITIDKSNVSRCSDKVSDHLKKLPKQKEKKMQEISEAERLILTSFESTVQALTTRRNLLLEELKGIKSNELKDFKDQGESARLYDIEVSSFVEYGRILMERGTDCEIIRVADELHKRAEELIKSQDDFNNQILKDSCIRFIPSPEKEIAERLIGEIHTGNVYDKRKTYPSVTSITKTFNRSALLNALDKYRFSSFDVVDAKINSSRNLVKIRCCVKQDSICSPEDLVQFREYLENHRGNYKLEIGLIAQIPKCELTSSNIGPGTGLAYHKDELLVRQRLNRSIGTFVNVSDLGAHILTAGHDLTINTEVWSSFDRPSEFQSRGCLGKVVSKCVTSETLEESDTIDAALIKINESISLDYFRKTVTQGTSEKGISSIIGYCSEGDTVVRVYNDKNTIIRGTVIELDSNRFSEPQYRGCLEIENANSNHDFHIEGQSGVLVAQEPNGAVANRLIPVAMLTARCQENNRCISVAVPIDRTLDGLSQLPYAVGRHIEIIQSDSHEIDDEPNDLQEELHEVIDENQNITNNDVIQNGSAMQNEIMINRQPGLNLLSENLGLLNAILIAIISFICGLVVNNFLR